MVEEKQNKKNNSRPRLTVEEKELIIRDLIKTNNNSAVAKKYNVSEKSVRNLRKSMLSHDDNEKVKK